MKYHSALAERIEVGGGVGSHDFRGFHPTPLLVMVLVPHTQTETVGRETTSESCGMGSKGEQVVVQRGSSGGAQRLRRLGGRRLGRP